MNNEIAWTVQAKEIIQTLETSDDAYPQYPDMCMTRPDFPCGHSPSSFKLPGADRQKLSKPLGKVQNCFI